MRVRIGLRANQIVSVGLLAASMLVPLDRARADENLSGRRVFRVRLTAPVSSDSTVGSRVVAQVISPDAFAGEILEGRIVRTKSSGRADRESVLTFAFSKLYHETSVFEIDGEIKRASNSKGQANVDEEGHEIKYVLGPLKPAWLRPGMSPPIIYPIVTFFVGKADRITFDTGSELEIEVVQR